VRNARLLVQALRAPETVAALPERDWTTLIAAARAESLIGSLAWRIEGLALAPKLRRIFEDARHDFDQARRQALWEAEMARRALAPLGIPVILLKGTAYAAAGLAAGQGRSIGDLDILVPRASLEAVETALLGAGWEWVKEDGYDDLYYRQWMHELPPLIHRERDRMIDVHHTILPLTHRRRPDAAAMLADSVAHLIADGDLAGGLRNLWDLDRLLRDFGTAEGFWQKLRDRSRLHQLGPEVGRALRLARRLYGTPVDPGLAGRSRLSDLAFERRLLARNGWGRGTRKLVRLGFYVRSHWLRMPPLMLARHLLVKVRKG
jgi:hypothetical protein